LTGLRSTGPTTGGSASSHPNVYDDEEDEFDEQPVRSPALVRRAPSSIQPTHGGELTASKLSVASRHKQVHNREGALLHYITQSNRLFILSAL